MLPEIEALFHKLQVLLQQKAPHGLALAYSGGLDSRFTAHAVQAAGLPLLLLHIAGPHVPPEDSEAAARWASARGLPFRRVEASPLALPAVAEGRADRCYACKHALFARLRAESPLPLADGTQHSDTRGYRPGLRALAELGVFSPLLEAGFDKAAVRLAARWSGLDDPDQAARPCLLTRLAYGLAPTEERLATLAKGEQNIRNVLEAMRPRVPDFRLRLLAPDVWELHVQGLSPEETSGLRQRLERAEIPPLARVVSMESVSGYFDRHGS